MCACLVNNLSRKPQRASVSHFSWLEASLQLNPIPPAPRPPFLSRVPALPPAATAGHYDITVHVPVEDAAGATGEDQVETDDD